MHENLLKTRSGFFAKALKMYQAPGDAGSLVDDNTQTIASMWSEGATGVVKLPTDDAAIFALYVQLLYYGTIPLFEKAEDHRL